MSVTFVPDVTAMLHEPLGQLIPLGLEVTLPDPVTDTLTVYDVGGFATNCADTDRFEVIDS